MTNQIKILTDHAQWLKDCQRDADVQDAIAWAITRIAELEAKLAKCRNDSRLFDMLDAMCVADEAEVILKWVPMHALDDDLRSAIDQAFFAWKTSDLTDEETI